ncbi:hypothetical protein ACH61_00916 [Rathayibacter tanaceti]|uniref:Uncharacterized protein n=1 Tax=Rathayibacter tanaceti TaxID=1671680 RepID=A0A168G9S2_9MICO|nr:hypothetical protein ACH61_00916 [Rathayibacter tanaceti]
MPTIMFESMNWPRIRAAERATLSSRSISLVWSGTGTMCAVMSKWARTSAESALARSSGERIWMSTSPVARACDSSRDTEEREVCSSWAMASIVRSCM